MGESELIPIECFSIFLIGDALGLETLKECPRSTLTSTSSLKLTPGKLTVATFFSY